eukprot:gene9594-biopygen18225
MYQRAHFHLHASAQAVHTRSEPVQRDPSRSVSMALLYPHRTPLSLPPCWAQGEQEMPAPRPRHPKPKIAYGPRHARATVLFPQGKWDNGGAAGAAPEKMGKCGAAGAAPGKNWEIAAPQAPPQCKIEQIAAAGANC